MVQQVELVGEPSYQKVQPIDIGLDQHVLLVDDPTQDVPTRPFDSEGVVFLVRRVNTSRSDESDGIASWAFQDFYRVDTVAVPLYDLVVARLSSKQYSRVIRSCHCQHSSSGDIHSAWNWHAKMQALG